MSSSEDRLEETKRRKLARKCEKLVELMMVSGVPTASGYEERIQFSEMEVVERGANEGGLLVNMPEGHAINNWDVNVAAVRVTSVKRTVRYHPHAVSAMSRWGLLISSAGYMLTSRPAGIYHPSLSQRWRRVPRRQAIRRIHQASPETAH